MTDHLLENHNPQIADAMRSPKDMFMPDQRGLSGFETTTIESWHSLINERINVSENVPLDIKIQLENIKNLLLYSWCVYRFGMVVATQSYNSIELALNLILEKNKIKPEKGMDWKLKKSIELNLIPEDSYSKKISGIKKMRNDANHGSSSLLPPLVMLKMCEVCTEVINRLYEK
jgi:hypothetical protein